MDNAAVYLNSKSKFWVFRTKKTNDKPIDTAFKREMTHVAVRKALKVEFPSATNISVMPPSKRMRGLKASKLNSYAKPKKAA